VLAREEFQSWLPGLHLEGPFLSNKPGAVGAHNPDWTTSPSVELFEMLQRWSGGLIKLFTLSPELPGADKVARAACAAGVAVSLGHTLANADDLHRLTQTGARAFTHLGNALPVQLPKFANPIWPALANDGLTAMLIADGHHVTDDFLKSVIRAKGVNRVIITSDASPVAGLPPGKYHALGNEIVLEANGRLHNPSRGFLVGSSATLLQCMNHLASLGLLSLDELIQVGFVNPLRLIGIAPERIPQSSIVSFDRGTKCFSPGPH
jgi:N-acetylglucosamine-6-phosphate deacetylase